MEHLRLAIGLMAFLSVAVFVVTARLLHNVSATMLNLLAVVVLGLIGAYMYLVWGQLWIVNWIPLPSVIVLSNWFPIMLALLAAILWNRMRAEPVWRRAPAQLALLGVAVWTMISVIPVSPPKCGDEWLPPEPPVPWRICLQTTPYTCSAASVATILESLGIAATEAEMARLSLTRRGTTWLGMYHGLSIKLMGTGMAARFFEGSVEDVARLTAQRPVLLCCQLTEEVAALSPKYKEEYGWIPGVLHSVVCFGTQGDLFLIGDPSQRRMERWQRRDLINLWTGTGLLIADLGESN